MIGEKIECKQSWTWIVNTYNDLVFMMQHQKVRQFDYGNELLIGTQDLG